MIRSLPLFHRIAGEPVLVAGMGEAADAKAQLVERAGGEVVRSINLALEKGVRLAFVAYDDDVEAERAVSQLREAGLLVNAVDRPELCDFTTPSILDRDPVLIAIGTDGQSAGLAKHIRLRLERLLPASLGLLAEGLYTARDRLRRRWPNPTDRRAALDEALKEGGMLDPLVATSHERVGVWIEEGAPVTNFPGTIIQLTSADPEDLTIRHARLLGEADEVLFERGVPRAILNRARADAARSQIERETGIARIREHPRSVLLLAPRSNR